MSAEKAIRLARKHVGRGAEMDSSARACLADAVRQFDAGEFDLAVRWAKKSLTYSVGQRHADYKAVSAMVFIPGLYPSLYEGGMGGC